MSESLADRINAGDKTLADCWNYIVRQAKSQSQNGCACCADNEVFGWAIHYFEEEQITETKDGAPTPGITQSATSSAAKKEKAEKAKASGKEKTKKADPAFDQLSMFD